MRLSHQPFLLELRHPFRLATGMRTHTNVTLTRIELGPFSGNGEAAMPPYYGETHASSALFLDQATHILEKTGDEFLRLDSANRSQWIADLMRKVDDIAPGNNAAKASVDIALHNLWSSVEGKPLHILLGTDPRKIPPTSFTLGMDTPEILRQKLTEATGFEIIKIKLGSDDDSAIIRTVREYSDLPIYADANQGWRDRGQALELVHWLAEQGVKLIEQPFHKDDLASSAWLTERSPLPVFADESFQRLADLDWVADSFHGVNVKLMKCTGISEALRIVEAARKKGMKLMTGCMTETSCGILAAAAIAPLFDYADLDGCWLVNNNPYPVPPLENGKIILR